MIGTAFCIQVNLKRIGQLRSIAGGQCVVRNIGGMGHAVDGDGIVNDLRARSVVNRDDVMPGVTRERLENNARAFPLLGGVVEDPPCPAAVVRLPGIVVGVAIRVLLALKFQGLRRGSVLCGDVEIELVPQITRRITHGRLLDEVIPAAESRTSRDPKIG